MTTLHPRRFGRALLIAIPLALAAPLAFAGFRGFGHGFAHPESAEEALAFAEPVIEHLLDEVDARPDQRKAIEAIVEDSVRELWDVRARGRELRKDFAEAMAAGATEAELEPLRQQAVDLMDEASRVGLHRMVEVRDVLDADQRSKLKAMRDRFGDAP
jgi:hypothetical protein